MVVGHTNRHIVYRLFYNVFLIVLLATPAFCNLRKVKWPAAVTRNSRTTDHIFPDSNNLDDEDISVIKVNLITALNNDIYVADENHHDAKNNKQPKNNLLIAIIVLITTLLVLCILLILLILTLLISLLN